MSHKKLQQVVIATWWSNSYFVTFAKDSDFNPAELNCNSVSALSCSANQSPGTFWALMDIQDSKAWTPHAFTEEAGREATHQPCTQTQHDIQ